MLGAGGLDLDSGVFVFFLTYGHFVCMLGRFCVFSCVCASDSSLLKLCTLYVLINSYYYVFSLQSVDFGCQY